jgi:hypothetical protein
MARAQGRSHRRNTRCRGTIAGPKKPENAYKRLFRPVIGFQSGCTEIGVPIATDFRRTSVSESECMAAEPLQGFPPQDAACPSPARAKQSEAWTAAGFHFCCGDLRRDITILGQLCIERPDSWMTDAKLAGFLHSRGGLRGGAISR